MKSLGAHVINTTKVSPNGTADLLCCLDGRFIAIEVKRSKKGVSPRIFVLCVGLSLSEAKPVRF